MLTNSTANSVPEAVIVHSKPTCRTFHYFPDLPKELRDKIWDMALRPGRPAAHFFTIFDPNDGEDERYEVRSSAI
ncbi:hypothetical protein B0H63DRAFT_467860 [Podospora didyma]|uniref:2EXR domain-containing protein n=1 Tax=Podospora didyma TaxID=330526 RepID=A0AAE0NRQ1_9PEZI|nr:hypothetical protein B0H63DRAFT_467860 [Podospora didyma]